MSDSAPIGRFAALVEEGDTGRHHRRPDDVDPEMGKLVALARQLARVPQPSPRRQFRQELMLRLMAASAAVEAAEPAVPGQRRDEQGGAHVWPINAHDSGTAVAPRPRRGLDDQSSPGGADTLANQKTQIVRLVGPRRGRRARLAALVGVATGALAISGVAVASNGAVPGDLLYPVKRSAEQAKLIVAGPDANRGRLHLDFARSRLVEARRVAPDAAGGVLAEMDREIVDGARLLFTVGFEAGDPAPVETVAAFVTQQRNELTRLRAEVALPGDPVQRSLDLLAGVEIRANELRAALADGCTTVTMDRLGPDPSC